MSNLYKVGVGNQPLAGDINQIIDFLNGVIDVGAIPLAPPINAPSGTFAATPATGTVLGIGIYIYRLTYVVGIKKSDNTYVYGNETDASTSFSLTTTNGNQAGSLSGLPTTWPSTAIGLRIYRTAVNGADGTEKLFATLNAPTATYTDTTADASLGQAIPTTNTTGTSISAMDDDWQCLYWMGV